MKTIILNSTFLVLIGLLGSEQLHAQSKECPTPDIENKMYYYDEKNNDAVDMEKADLEDMTRTRGYGGIGTKEQVWQVAGEKSSVRIKKKAKQNFLMKLNAENAKTYDMGKNYFLLKLKYNPKTKSREMISMKQSSWSDKTDENYETIRFTTQKVKDIKNSEGQIESIVRMVTVENLEPGEYVFMEGWDGRDALFFGVDE